MALLKPPRRKCRRRCACWRTCCGYPDAELRDHLPEMRAALHDERALTVGRLAELDALIDRLRTRRALEVEADYVELFDRGRGTALHLFEHVHGDSRDRGPAMIDLVQTYERRGPVPRRRANCPTTCTVVLEYASTQPPRAGARLPRRDGAHPAGHLQRAAAARERATPACWPRCSTWPARRPRPVHGAAPSPSSTRAGTSRWPSTAARPQGQARPGQPQPDPDREARGPPGRRPELPRSIRMNATSQLPLHRLPVHLPGRVLHGQPGPLRPRPVHLEERLVAAAAHRPVALGQQPVPRRHPVPVLRPPVRPADAARGLRALRHRAAEAAAGGGRRRHRRRASASSA